LYDYAAIARVLTPATLAERPQNHWRYRELLPIRDGAALPELSVGWTPLTAAPALAQHVGVGTLYLKDEGRGPTGSMKDRASALGVVKAVEQNKKIVSCASTGNAASSLAGMAACMGLKSVIFLPEHAPEPKIAQLLIFGATVIRVRGSYEEAFQLCQQSWQRWRWYNRNAAVNPYLAEGNGVQAAGAAPVTEAFRSGQPLLPMVPHTIADSIAVGVPRNGKKALQRSRNRAAR
jgi:threonine synthase